MRRLIYFVFMLLAVVPVESGQLPPSPVVSVPTALIHEGQKEKAQEPGQNFGPPKPPEETPMSAVQAVDLALQDIQKVNPYDRRYIRYLWCQRGDFKSPNLALNIVSRGTNVIRALPVTQNRKGELRRGLDEGVLVRVDLRHYCRFSIDVVHNHDLEEWIKYWEYLKYDPTFNLLITKDNTQFAEGKLPNRKKKTKTIDVEEKLPEPITKDGVRYTHRWVEKTVETDEYEEDHNFLVLRFNPDYLPNLAKLQQALYTEAPICLDRYFMARALHTVKVDPVSKDNTAWSVIWGGLYYEFRGIKHSTQSGTTDEDLFFQQFGINNAAKLFDSLQSDQRAAIFHSGVTGRKRRVDFFNTPSGYAWNQMGVGSVTHDIRTEDTDVGTHPLMNLLTFKDQAREDIFVGPNGFHAYAIFNGDGKLLDEATNNVVSDRTVPDPHPPRLQSAMSCIACHEAEGSDGWKSVGNDVKKMLGNRIDPITGQQKLDLDIIADTNHYDQVGVMNRLAGLYLGDFKKGMIRSRDDYAETILNASGPQGEDQTHIVKTAMSKVVNTTRTYVYDDITPAQALRELGVAPGNDPAEELRTLLPPEPTKLGFASEDPRVHALKKGISIPRTDWAFIQSFCASRIAKHANHQNKGH